MNSRQINLKRLAPDCGRDFPEKKPVIIDGNRGGGKELVYYSLCPKGSWHAEPIVLDECAGATNVAILSEDDHLLVASANHAYGEVSLYELSFVAEKNN